MNASSKPSVQAFEAMMAAAADVDPSGTFYALAGSVLLHQDPGASVPYVEAVAAAISCFPPSDEVQEGPMHHLRRALAAVTESQSWLDGTWHRTANVSRRGGRHGGSVDDRPLLACLVADRRASLERPTLDGLRLLLVMSLVQGNDPAGFVVTVAEAVRKAEAMESWRQVMRAIPAPPPAETDLVVWTMAVQSHLASAQPPSDLAQVPAASIRLFFHALQKLIRSIDRTADQPLQRSLLSEDETDPRGEIRIRSAPRQVKSALAHSSGASGDGLHLFDERRPTIQEVLVFDDETKREDGPANLHLATTPPIGQAEQPQGARSERSDLRLTSYRLIEMSQRLRWAWDHLNPLDCQVLLEAIRQDLLPDNPRWRGAALCAVMLLLGRSVDAAMELGLGHEVAGGDYIDDMGRWHRPVRRPPKAWKAARSLDGLLCACAEEITVEVPALLRNVIMMAKAANADSTGSLSDLLSVAPDQADQFLSDWLTPLRRRHPSARLTAGRIARALSVELFAAAGEELVVHSFTGTVQSVPPISSYYVALDDAKLAEACHAAWSSLLDEPIPVAARAACVLGAPVLTHKALTAWTSHLHAAVIGAAGLAGQHNAYCRYTLSLLMAATGIRPVTDPFESLDLLDLALGLAVIADKASHHPDEARLIKLAPAAVRMIENWLEHLRRLARWVNDSHAALSLKIETVIRPTGARALPLFFLLDDDLQPQHITATMIASWWPAGLEGLPANQSRRELASAMVQEQWPTELAQQSLGHIDLGQAVFGALSCLSPVGMNQLIPGLNALLQRQGWQTLASPLEPGPTRRGKPLSLLDPEPAVLGSAKRATQLAANAKRTEAHIDRTLRAWRRGRDLRTLEQEDIDLLYRQALRDRASPGTDAEVKALRRIDRLLRWLKRRYALTPLTLPASRSLALLPVQHMRGDMELFHVWQRLRAAFEQLLQQRARRALATTPAGQLAEAVVGAVLYSFLCDQRILLTLASPNAWKLSFVDGLGVFLVVEQTWPGKDVAIQRYPLQPLSALLLGRSADFARDISQVSRSECRRSLLRQITNLRRDAEAGSATDFTTPEAALRWLCLITATAARLRLPGHLVAYLDGSTESVGLAEHDWSRWMFGRATARGVPRHDEEADTSQPDRPAACIASSPTAAVEAVARSRALALHRSVREIFRRVKQQAIDHAEHKQKSLNRSEVLIPLLEQTLENHSDAPDFTVVAVQWLVDLLRSGADERALKSVSAERYYVELISGVIDTLSAHALPTIDEDTLTSAFSEMLERIAAGRMPYMWGRLLEFHKFLMRHHGVPQVDWTEIAPEGLERSHAPDAGVLLWPEYIQALTLLADDPDADRRERLLQACVFLLMFRFGLRAGECLGMRASDLVKVAGQWVVLVRRNAYRDLKSDAGVRQVPLIGPLSDLEVSVLEGWLAHADENVGNDRCGALLAQREEPRRLVDRNRVMARIAEAMRTVTGRPTAHPHHLRHAYASRMALLLCTSDLPPNAARRRILERMCGPCMPAEARRVLLDTRALSKRSLWALAMAIGHASPTTTLRWYIHVHDFLLVTAFEEISEELEVRLDTATAAYAIGQQLAPSRRRVVFDDALVRRHLRIVAPVPSADHTKEETPTSLPPRKASPPVPLDLLTVDRLLELMHRRGRIDGSFSDRLMLRPEVITRLVQDEFACRDMAGYDLAVSGWHPTSGRSAVNHVRAGSRLPAETERVRAFCRRMADRIHDADWCLKARNATRVWAQRYRATSTPLIVTSVDEAGAFVDWCLTSSIPPEHQVILVPIDGGIPNGLERLHSDVERVAAPLGSARVQYRGQTVTRLGFQLRENDVGPLTRMTQLHRVMHVLSAWLASTTKE